MLGSGFGEDVAEIGGDGEVASFEALVVLQPGPAPVDAAAFHRSAEQQHRVAVAVVGAPVAVLRHGASKLGHRDDDGVGHKGAKLRDTMGMLRITMGIASNQQEI